MYNEFYGFSEKPFEVTPDPKFLYFTSSHREALDTMIKGIRNRWGFICITGEVGTGKTTLIHSLLNRRDEKVKTVFIFHTLITFKELLGNILMELDQEVTGKSKEALLNHLVEYLSHGLCGDETLAVIIDEAQNLSEQVIEELGRLSELEPRISVRLQMVFVGQPEFEGKLNSPGLRKLNQRIGIRREIKALTEEESREYVEHRLRLVGRSSAELFTPKAMSMIIRHAQGIPRVINILCDNAFLIGYGLSRRKVDEDIIREVKKNMEGPESQKAPLTKIGMVVKEFLLASFGRDLFPRRIFLILLALLFLGGLVFVMHGFLQRRPLDTRSIESIMNPLVRTEASSISPSPQAAPEQTSDLANRLPPVGRESVLNESLQHVVPPSASSMTRSSGDMLLEAILVQKGQSISSLAQRYYRKANTTLIDLILDFNPEITNVHLILIDQRIEIPIIMEERLIIQSPDRTYKIHVGTFWTPDFAKFYRHEPLLKGKDIEIFDRRVAPGETWYQVVVGKFGNKDEALKVIDLLREKGLLPLFGGTLKLE
ncbi:MAG: AAA family ATPase [Thermodesulfobacteriota bacterium]|jgi:general secretion pathway protein A